MAVLGNPGIVPPQSPFLSLTYSEWAAEWFQWAYSMLSTRHLLFDNADCSEGQTSDVCYQPLRPLRRTPSTMRRLATRKTTSRGKALSAAPAMMGP